jgi:Cu(I)/Ag(I) efflux system periplasmic protein CusF
MNRRTLLGVLLAAFVALPALAQQGPALASGEVRKVDKAKKTITLKHGPIPSIDMPPMTMVFDVKDPAMLDKVKAGDKVKFQAAMIGGKTVVTQIEPAK